MTDEFPPAGAAELDDLELLIGDWLQAQLESNPSLLAVDRDPRPAERRWLVKVSGDEKVAFSIWFHLQQRTLEIETHVAPAPMQRPADFYEYFLHQNHRLKGVSFGIGAEDAVYLRGHLRVSEVDEAQLDRLFGSVYAATEMCFRPAMRIGYGDRFES